MLLSLLLDWAFRLLQVPEMVEAEVARGKETANDGPREAGEGSSRGFRCYPGILLGGYREHLCTPGAYPRVRSELDRSPTGGVADSRPVQPCDARDASRGVQETSGGDGDLG